MLPILLMILKILGIVILAVLGLMAAVLFLVFLVPVRYGVSGSYYGKPRGTVKITWLLHALSVKVTYEDGLDVTARVLGKRVFQRKEEGAKVKEELEEDLKDTAGKVMDLAEEGLGVDFVETADEGDAERMGDGPRGDEEEGQERTEAGRAETAGLQRSEAGGDEAAGRQRTEAGEAETAGRQSSEAGEDEKTRRQRTEAGGEEEAVGDQETRQRMSEGGAGEEDIGEKRGRSGQRAEMFCGDILTADLREDGGTTQECPDQGRQGEGEEKDRENGEDGAGRKRKRCRRGGRSKKKCKRDTERSRGNDGKKGMSDDGFFDIEDQEEDRKSPEGGLTGKAKRAAESVKTAWSRMEEYKEKALSFWNDEQNHKTIKVILRQIKAIIRHIIPRKVRGKAVFGFDDPGTTGKVLSGLSVVYAWYGDKFEIVPVFDRQILEVEGSLKGRVQAGALLARCVRVLLDKNFRRLLWGFLKNGGK